MWTDIKKLEWYMYCVIRGNEDLRLSAVAGTNVVERLANEAIPLSMFLSKRTDRTNSFQQRT